MVEDNGPSAILHLVDMQTKGHVVAIGDEII